MAIRQLPFVSTADGKLNPWNPDRSGNYSEQCARGREYARHTAQVMHDAEDPTLLLTVVRKMETAQMSGVEIGFMTEMGIFITTHPNA